MKTWSVTIGHNVGGVPTWTRRDVTDAAARVLGVDAFSAIPCRGMWCGEYEDSTRIEVCDVDAETAAELTRRAGALCAALALECVMCETRESDVLFVGAETAAAASAAGM